MTLSATAAPETYEVAGLEPPSATMRRRTSVAGLLGGGIVIIVAVLAVTAPLIAPHDPALRDLGRKLRPPFWLEGGSLQYPLGTDGLGRDVWSRILHGSRISLLVGIGSVAVSGVIGLTLGVLSGYVGRFADLVIMRLVDALLAIPTILFMLVVVMVAGSGVTVLVLVIGLTSWVTYTRVVRAETLVLRDREFVAAAKAAGAGTGLILRRHIVPNVLSSFVVVATLATGGAILAESSLSYLGLGIQPPQISWGGLLSDGRDYLSAAWWVATFPGLAITLTVFGLILLGDWLRDLLDPRLRG